MTVEGDMATIHYLQRLTQDRGPTGRTDRVAHAGQGAQGSHRPCLPLKGGGPSQIQDQCLRLRDTKASQT